MAERDARKFGMAWPLRASMSSLLNTLSHFPRAEQGRLGGGEGGKRVVGGDEGGGT
jgi:hypothetical protein